MNRVAIIVPLWNQVSFTKQFVQSLYTHTDHKDFTLILVDNGSTDKTPKYLQMIQKAYKNLHIITLEENTGYVGGINAGLHYIDEQKEKPEFILFGNNDIEVTKDWLSKMTGYFVQYEDLGGLGPVSNNVAGPQHITWNDRFGESGIQTVKYLIGFWLLIPFRVYTQIGKLDDRFGKGFSDDIDYSIRVRDAGYALGIARDVFIVHHGSASYKQLYSLSDYQKDLEEKHKKLVEKWGEEKVMDTMHVDYYNGTIAFASQEVVPVEFSYSVFHMLNRSTDWIHVYNGKSTLDMKVKNESVDKAQGKYLLYLHHHSYFKDTLLEDVKKYAEEHKVDVVCIPFQGEEEKKFAAIYMNGKALSQLHGNVFMYMKHGTEDDYFVSQCVKHKIPYKKATPAEFAVKHIDDVKKLDEYKPTPLKNVEGTIGIPCMEFVHVWFVVSMFRFLTGKKETYKIVMTNNESVDKARNKIVEQMNGDWLWFIDSDQTFKDITLRRLLSHNQPIVGAMVFKKVAPYLPCVYARSPEGYGYHALMWPWPNQPFIAEMTGTGCVLIRKEVFEAVGSPWFEYTDKSGEDINFFEKAQEAGYQIVIDPLLPIGHTTMSEVGVKEYLAHNHPEVPIRGNSIG